MKTPALALALAAATTLLSGCYANLSAPTPNLSVKMDAQDATKRGSASCTAMLWAFASGDCSVNTAMKNGRITKVHHVDSEAKVVFWGAYAELNIVVHGE